MSLLTGPLNIISSPRVLCTLRYPWWPPWRGNHHLQAQGVQQQKPRSFGSSKRSQRASFFPLKLPMVGSNESFLFGVNKKPIFQRLFAVSFREFFFHVWNLTPWQKSTFFCNTFPVPSLGAFWFINFKPCRIFLVSFLDVFFGGNETKRGLNWCSAK